MALLFINKEKIIADLPGDTQLLWQGGFGWSAALHGAITLKDGVVLQSNSHDYPPHSLT